LLVRRSRRPGLVAGTSVWPYVLRPVERVDVEVGTHGLYQQRGSRVGGSPVDPGTDWIPQAWRRGPTLPGMDTRNEIREFLTSRRGRITPGQAGLPVFGGSRRVPGLRREEVALLAGVSVDYYTRLERGNLSGVSESVLEALARALQLDDAERAHLFDLARAAGPPTTLYCDMFDDPVRPANHARFVFLSPRAQRFYANWDRAATDTVAILRSEAGRDPYDRNLSELIGELSTRSEEFRTRWAAHNVRIHRTGAKDFHHPVVGDLSLTFEMMQLTADADLAILAYSAEPGSRSEEGLSLLASWAATPDAAATTGG
jgi:transcriptional regulator with XRE-family HTH domain